MASSAVQAGSPKRAVVLQQAAPSSTFALPDPIPPADLSAIDIEDIAVRLARAVDFDPLDPSSLDNVLDAMGAEVHLVDFWELDPKDAISLDVDEPGCFDIYVPDRTMIEAQRFAVAHEIGHYILHYLHPIVNKQATPMPHRFNRYSLGQADKEASWFAAGFLMPGNKFRTTYEKHNKALALVARDFGVTIRAATNRAKFLELK
jgi:predicted transcriptional regulator